jgi:DNA-binding Lrp family transcriptional regulator
MKAFILCKFVVGLEQKAMAEIKKIRGVREVDVTFGTWDAVVIADAENIDKLSALVVREIRGIHGVLSTDTLVTTVL